jgi:hypothetical protein
MLKRYIVKDPNFRTLYSIIANDSRIFLHFKDYIGAIDSSHINAIPTEKKHFIMYIERCCKPTQNVMVVVDFDMCFTYASIGQPSSMHDTNVLYTMH